MKTIVLSAILLVSVNFIRAQNVNIPDANFKNALISAGVDEDEDGEISYNEAEAVDSIDVSGGWSAGARCTNSPEGEIISLEGIESFNNLLFLDCSGNKLSSLDVSNNTLLTELDCSINYLTSLDVTGCIALKVLSCFQNPLTTLDVSQCTFLTELYLQCNFQLYEVRVWEIPLPESISVIYYSTADSFSFTTECSTNFLDDYKEDRVVEIYPNPSDDIINIDIENLGIAIVEMYDFCGKNIFRKQINSKVEKIEVIGYAPGLYMIIVNLDDSSYARKIVIK